MALGELLKRISWITVDGMHGNTKNCFYQIKLLSSTVTIFVNDYS